MREKLFTLTRSQRVAMWQRFKQTDDRRLAEIVAAWLSKRRGRVAFTTRPGLLILYSAY